MYQYDAVRSYCLLLKVGLHHLVQQHPFCLDWTLLWDVVVGVVIVCLKCKRTDEFHFKQKCTVKVRLRILIILVSNRSNWFVLQGMGAH